jgi:protein-serine/threonine kinase
MKDAGDKEPALRSSSVASRNGSGIRLSDSTQVLGPPVRPRSRAKPYTGIDGQGEESSANTPALQSDGEGQRPGRGAHSHLDCGSENEYVSMMSRDETPGNTGLGIGSSSSIDLKSNGLHREQYLAVHRGITLPTVRPPSPPRSSGSGYSTRRRANAKPGIPRHCNRTGRDRDPAGGRIVT